MSLPPLDSLNTLAPLRPAAVLSPAVAPAQEQPDTPTDSVGVSNAVRESIGNVPNRYT